jgi:hypothetical protein
LTGKDVVRTYFNADKTRQVVVFRRTDTSFGFEELKFDSDERAWFPCGCSSASFTDNIEAAVREARTRVEWLAKIDG